MNGKESTGGPERETEAEIESEREGNVCNHLNEIPHTKRKATADTLDHEKIDCIKT